MATDLLIALLGLALLTLPLQPAVRAHLRRMLRRAYSRSFTANIFARRRDKPFGMASTCTVFDAVVVLAPVFALPILLWQPGPIMPTLGLGAILLLLVLFDLRYRWLPDALTLPLLPAGVLLAGLLEPKGGLGVYFSLAGLIGAASLIWLVGWAFRRWRGMDGIGGGDIKLIACMGAWLGPSGAATAIATASITALIVELSSQLVVNGHIDHRRHIPFGVYLAGAFWLLWCGQYGHG